MLLDRETHLFTVVPFRAQPNITMNPRVRRVLGVTAIALATGVLVHLLATIGGFGGALELIIPT